jgi:hypothetical protein
MRQKLFALMFLTISAGVLALQIVGSPALAMKE